MRERFGELFLSYGVNYYTADKPLAEMLRQREFHGDDDLETLGRLVSTEMVEAVDIIDHRAPPFLQTWGLLGNRIDYVRISPEHRRILSRLIDLGVTRKSVAGTSPWLYHFVSGYLISDTGLFCTLTLTAQTGYALQKYGDPSLKERYLHHFLPPAGEWLGATFYSEIQGGSDLGANRTLAEPRGESWVLNGEDKYFASNAGLADAALVTAKRAPPREGVRGLSFFFVPAASEPSGDSTFEIRRLKDKLGTVAVPTGEVVLKDTPAFLLGSADQGVYYALEVLNISRLDNAFASVGIARKSLWEAYRYALHRKTFGKTLIEHPLLARDLLEMEADVEGGLALALESALAFQRTVDTVPPYDDVYHYARLLAHVAKYSTAIMSREVTSYAMEVLGGIGFFEEFPLAKLHRDALVTPIWEGTSNIQALDALEVIMKKQAHELLLRDLTARIEAVSTEVDMKHDLGHMLGRLRTQIDDIVSSGEKAVFYAKDLIGDLGELATATYLLSFADRLRKEKGEGWAMALAQVYFHRHIARESTPAALLAEIPGALGWMG